LRIWRDTDGRAVAAERGRRHRVARRGDPAATAPSLIKAGVVEALGAALQEALPGGMTANGDATPTARILPRHAVATLNAICQNDDARRRAAKAGCLDACKRILAFTIDPKSATCRIAAQESLRFLSYYMLFDRDGAALNEAVVPGALALTKAPEVATRRAALNSLLYIRSRRRRRDSRPARASGTSFSASTRTRAF